MLLIKMIVIEILLLEQINFAKNNKIIYKILILILKKLFIATKNDLIFLWILKIIYNIDKKY
jgi:hypothetical protein